MTGKEVLKMETQIEELVQTATDVTDDLVIEETAFVPALVQDC